MIGTCRDEEGQAVPRWRTLRSPATGSPHRDLVLRVPGASLGRGTIWRVPESVAPVRGKDRTELADTTRAAPWIRVRRRRSRIYAGIGGGDVRPLAEIVRHD